MTINGNLFKAILAMDSYNRGYDGAVQLDVVLNSTKIGDATIIAARGQPDAQAIGFYALAYDYE
ncbi:MAG: hypothetical protein KA099_09420 [Alphaproteobacteria bacterium]|nr:hypothetical protein [Alphaproteobacteria bacterium]MBP7759048.1 hypothetical protein [Alphaproteobacteria bacterium]MBP7762322.1 hypothetical protein [Alphaproteobacteria bacterium]MBP7905532.1 hypothetical protein [Alphaproteobacteria bacterium]